MSFNVQSLTQKAETRLFSEIKKSFGAPKPTAENVIKENNQQRLFESARNAAFIYDIFLSHRAEDAQVILGLLDSLNDYGYTVYVDWKDDPQLDRTKVNKTTANLLRERMNQSKSLLFATTENAGASRWMPWELGYMDGKKDRAAILPIFQTPNSSTDSYKGQEYLGIYPYTVEAPVQNSTENKMWVCEAADIYVSFDKWLTGTKPYKR